MAKKVYNVPQAAKELGVHEQTIRYWMKKGWIKPKRDYRNYPVFTKDDLKKINKWREELKEA